MPEETLLDKAKNQIDSRRGNYGAKRHENSFPYIARRLRTWALNNFGIDLPWEDWHVADMMHEFKRGRAESRRAAGAPAVPDDPVDAIAYEQWAEWLRGDAQTVVDLDNDDTAEMEAVDD